MTKEDLAVKLNQCQYTEETTPELEAVAKASGLVIIFGASDDLMEFRGAIDDEVGCWDGGKALIDSKGVLPAREQIDNDEDLEDFFQRRKTAKEIEAIWAKGEYSWQYKTAIPHAVFDVLEDSDKYCQGIVIDLRDLGVKP